MSTTTPITTSRKPKQSREAARREKQRLETSVPREVQREKLMAAVADAGAKTPPSKTKISAPAITSPYLTTTEAAAYLKLSRQFLEGARWHADGSGPDYVQLGRSVRYIKATLDAWMTSNIHSADKPVVPQARAARST